MDFLTLTSDILILSLAALVAEAATADGVVSVLWAQAPTTFWIKMPSKSTTIHTCAQAEYDQIRGWNVKEHLVAEVQVVSKLWAPSMSLLTPQSLKFVEWHWRCWQKTLTEKFKPHISKYLVAGASSGQDLGATNILSPCDSECHLAALSATLLLSVPPCAKVLTPYQK